MKQESLDINISRMADFIDRHIASVPFLEKGVPPFSSIEFSNNGMCNRRCIFCPRVDAKAYPNINKHLSFDLFRNLMKDLAGIDYCGRISFSGFCEPLLTKDLEKYISAGKEICPEMTIEIASNGDPLTLERLNSIFKAGLDNIRLSLYEGPHQEKEFEAMKKEVGLSDKQFIFRGRYLGSEKNYGLTISNRAGAITLVNENVSLKPLDEPLNQPCHYPFYKMMVDYTGEAMICSNDWRKNLIVGDLNNQNVFDIWNSDKFTRVRLSLIRNDRKFTPCRCCDVNGLYNGKSHFDAWINFYKKNRLI